MRILVVGATGLVGRPVARQLADDGFDVRVLVRDIERARSLLGAGVDCAAGAVDDEDSLQRALRGCHGVHVSLAARRGEELDRVERDGTERVARRAADRGVTLLTYVTGSLVHVDYGEKIPEHRAKLGAEEAIEASGVPYVFFRPTYLIDNLPRHIQGGRAVALGRSPPLHMVAAADFAHMVSRAFLAPQAARRDLFVHGPEEVTIADALRLYCKLVEPDKRVVTVPLPLMRLADRLFLGGELRANLELMGVLQRVGERGDPAEANELLGAPTTTVRQWCEREAELRRGAPGRR